MSGHAAGQASSSSRDVEGYAPAVANDASPIGAGWSVGKIDSLVVVPASHNVPAGILYVYGYGQSRILQRRVRATAALPTTSAR